MIALKHYEDPKTCPQIAKLCIFDNVDSTLNKNKGLWYFFVNHTNHYS